MIKGIQFIFNPNIEPVSILNKSITKKVGGGLLIPSFIVNIDKDCINNFGIRSLLYGFYNKVGNPAFFCNPNFLY